MDHMTSSTHLYLHHLCHSSDHIIILTVDRCAASQTLELDRSHRRRIRRRLHIILGYSVQADTFYPITAIEWQTIQHRLNDFLVGCLETSTCTTAAKQLP